MTPKEKAEKLLKDILSKNPSRQDGISSIDVLYAKLCIEIMIKEILNELDSQFHIQISYWHNVKFELDQL